MALGDKIKSDIERKIAGMNVLGLAIGKDLETKARNNAPWVDRTGNTRRSIHGGSESRKSGITIYLAHGSLVGLFMEEGTKPHIIQPKSKKALRFTSGGETVFAKKVYHPGIKERPIVQNTVESNRNKIKQQVKRYWEAT